MKWKCIFSVEREQRGGKKRGKKGKMKKKTPTTMSVIHISSEFGSWMLNVECWTWTQSEDHSFTYAICSSKLYVITLFTAIHFRFSFHYYFCLLLLSMAFGSSNEFGFFPTLPPFSFRFASVPSIEFLPIVHCALCMMHMYVSDATMNGMFSFCFESIFHMLGIFCCLKVHYSFSNLYLC